MKKYKYFILTLFFISLSSFSQNVDDFKIKTKFYGANKMKKAPKKIFINSFNVNYEIYKEAVDFKRGGNGGRIGGNTSNATARAAVGLGGIDANKMQYHLHLLLKIHFQKDLNLRL